MPPPASTTVPPPVFETEPAPVSEPLKVQPLLLGPVLTEYVAPAATVVVLESVPPPPAAPPRATRKVPPFTVVVPVHTCVSHVVSSCVPAPSFTKLSRPFPPGSVVG